MANNYKNHFLSETAVWESVSEFVSPDGTVSEGRGESAIHIEGGLITNESWVIMQDKKMENMYEIKPQTENRYQYISNNPSLGIQRGYFDVLHNIIYSKFLIQETELNGYEIIRRIDSTCYANGALYNGDELINTWNAVLQKKEI